MSGMSPEQELMRVGSECYFLLEQYKLRANLVGINMDKELIEPSYAYLEERITDRYAVLFQKMKDQVNKLQTNFRIAQANSLRTLNNIFRNYRRRVGTLTNEPLAALKYGRYQRQQKMLLESMIYCQRQNKTEILAFRQQLQRSITGAVRQVEQRYRRNDKIRENYNTVFKIIDKSECYTYRYYQGFERTLLTTVAALQPAFDKLNAFLSVWENVGSTKAYEARTAREIQTEEKEHESGERRLRPSSYEEETEQHLEQLMKNYPQHSSQRQEYRKRLNQLRRYNSEKQKKLDMVGKMYSKRRNRAGILLNRGKEVSVLEWVINLDNSKVPYSYQDEFKHYRAENDHSEYRPTPYENQRPFKTAEEAREHLDKQRPPQLNHQWWYDRFGREGTLDLIGSQSQQVQKRVQFEVVRQTELQNSDDRRKRQLLQKQNYQMKDNERRECLHVGYRHIHDKTELDSLMERTYHTQYLPGIAADNDELQFSDQEAEASFEEEQTHTKVSAQAHPKKKEDTIRQESSLVKLEQKIEVKPAEKVEPQLEKYIQKEAPQMVRAQMGLEQQIITIYFCEFSKKMTRKEQQPQYKKTVFLYFKDIASIDWPSLQAHLTCEKIFIYTHRSILFFSRIFSATQEKIKCNVYTIQDEEEEAEETVQQTIHLAVQECFRNLSIVTVRFHPIYLETEEVTSFMIGLLMVLVREGKMFQDSEIKDYVNQGKDIIQDFNEYYFPAEDRSTKSFFMRKFMPQTSKELFAPKKQENKDNRSEASTTITAQRSIPSKSQEVKESKEVLKKEIVDQPQKKQKIQQQAPLLVIPQHQNSTPSYTNLHEQPQLKRSNSREGLLSMDMQLQLSKQDQYQISQQQNDYEQL